VAAGEVIRFSARGTLTRRIRDVEGAVGRDQLTEMEPGPWLERVSAVQKPSAETEREISELYQRAYPRLVGLLTAMSGSYGDAEEVAQEAYLRALARWTQVRGLDDPEAWVRLVAVRLLISRRRRVLRGFKVSRLLESRHPGPTAAPGPDRLAVAQALAQISLDHRAVAVLHYYLDMSIEEIAKELSIPAGTVKSRLSRARKNLAPLLTERTETAPHA
jgi:RNA polymerase sigma-70 factor, ECF subfamily